MDPQDEKYVAELIERMKKQNQNSVQMPNRSPEPVLNSDNNISEITQQATLSSIKTSAPPVPAQGIFSECPQCHSMHPPLKPGQKCPNAKVEVKEAGIHDEDINRFLASLKNIAVSQIQAKNIKDGNKLFQQLTLEMTKFLEGYGEDK